MPKDLPINVIIECMPMIIGVGILIVTMVIRDVISISLNIVGADIWNCLLKSVNMMKMIEGVN